MSVKDERDCTDCKYHQRTLSRDFAMGCNLYGPYYVDTQAAKVCKQFKLRHPHTAEPSRKPGIFGAIEDAVNSKESDGTLKTLQDSMNEGFTLSAVKEGGVRLSRRHIEGVMFEGKSAPLGAQPDATFIKPKK